MRCHRQCGLLVGLAAFALLTAACTSVQQAESVRAGGQGGAEVDGPGSSNGSTAESGDSTESTGRSADPGAGGPAGGDGDPEGGPGVDAGRTNGGQGPESSFAGCPLGGPLKLGVSFSSDLAAGLAAVGQPEAAASAGQYAENQKAAYGALVDDLNARGGVAGCEVTLSYFDFSSLASDGFDGQSQKECAYFAEDVKAFAVYSNALETETLVDCLAKRGVVSLFNGVEYAPIQRDFDRYRGYLYQPWQVNTDRWGQFIDLWDSVGFFGRDAKVGILVADDGTGNGQKLAYEVWQPKLKELGIETSVFEYKWIRSYASVSDASTAFSAAVLKFKSEGVTHVLPTPDGSAMSIFMTNIADSQDYYPAYGTTSFSGGTPATASESQSHNWVTVSWSLLTFRTSATDKAPSEAELQSNPARDRCDATIASVQSGVNTFHYFCDALDFLEAGLRESPEVSPDALLSGAEALGTTLPSASGLGPTAYGPGRYDAVAHVRTGKWDTSQDAYVYVTPPQKVP